MKATPGKLGSRSQCRPATLEDLGGVVDTIFVLLLRLERKLSMKISEGTAKIVALGDQLEKAQTEIVAEIQKLKDATADADLPPEATAAIERLGALADSLDALNPDEPTDPTTLSASKRSK
jgi:hypothetical protein